MGRKSYQTQELYDILLDFYVCLRHNVSTLEQGEFVIKIVRKLNFMTWWRNCEACQFNLKEGHTHND